MHYYKAILFGDKKCASQILKAKTPKTAKALGRKVTGFKPEIWDTYKTRIVLEGNILKFSQNKIARKALEDTGDSYLVEASPLDTIWGIGLSANSPDVSDPKKWKGTNLLGRILDQVKLFLREHPLEQSSKTEKRK
jgi:ribA/ribD-fused uncharacterized protein